jgi:hypothetical protein
MAEPILQKKEAEALLKQGRKTLRVRFLLACSLLGLPWLLGSAYLWNLSGDSFVAPLTEKAFELPFRLLLNHRIILNAKLMAPVLFFFSFLPLFILIAILATIYYILPPIKRVALSVLLATYYFSQGAPGTDPTAAAHSLFALLLVLPLFRSPPPLLLWMVATLGVLVAHVDKTIQIPLIWMTMSLLIGALLHFLFGERGVAGRKIRVHWAGYLLHFCALFLLGFWVLLAILSAPPDWTLFQPSSLWPLAWVVVLECIILASLQPAQTARWLARGTFAQGLALSSELNFLVILVAIGSAIEIILHPVVRKKIFDWIPPALSKIFQPASILIALTIMGWQVKNFRASREFESHWMSISNEMIGKDSQGFLIVGRGLPFLAHFISKPLISDDSTLLETDETDLLSHLKEFNVSDIIIEKKYLTEFWKTWIASGKPPETANFSVISRAITYQGEALNTPTLKFPALKELSQMQLDKKSAFVWLKTTKQVKKN